MKANHLSVTMFRALVLLLCVGFSWKVAATVIKGAHGAETAIDFDSVYCGVQCALSRRDPYDRGERLRELKATGLMLATGNSDRERASLASIAAERNLPTTFLVVAPIAMLGWPMAKEVWAELVCGLLSLAALSAWDLATDTPIVGGCMAGFMLLNCFLLLLNGNTAGIAVPLCVIAAWCFVKERIALAGAVLMALSLVIKPHDGGFVWLYFLLAGGTPRRRALQSLAIAAVIGLCAATWITPISPHWIQELHNVIAATRVRGAVNDPGPAGSTNRGLYPVVSLQSGISVFKDDPNFYDPASYAIAGGLILLWAVLAVRKRATREGTLLGLASVSILTLLPVYHRTNDAKLLLLTIPACALLWARRGKMRFVALGLTSAAILVTSDLPLIFWTAATGRIPVTTATLGGKLKLLALQPAPLVLLAAGCFYLWAYVRYKPPADESLADRKAAAGRAAEAAAT